MTPSDLRLHQTRVSALLRVLELPEALRARVHRREIGYVTALDLGGRHRTRNKGGGGGGKGQIEQLSGQDAQLITYWRRRHERLIAGVQKAARAQANGTTLGGLRIMLEQLVALDAKPLPRSDAA